LLAGDGAPAPPLPREAGYVWEFLTRKTDGAGWDRPEVPAPSATPALVPARRVVEGWLKLTPKE